MNICLAFVQPVRVSLGGALAGEAEAGAEQDRAEEDGVEEDGVDRAQIPPAKHLLCKLSIWQMNGPVPLSMGTAVKIA